MHRIFTLFLLTLTISSWLPAQMTTPEGTVYGNEWYTDEGNFLRVEVAEDGFYRIPADAIAGAGITATESGRWQLYHLGRPVPVAIQDGDVVFYGERARAELDQYLLEGGEEALLNPRYGMYTDTSAYYLGIGTTGEEVLRFGDDSGAAGGTPTSTIYRSVEKVYTQSHSKFFRRTTGLSIYFSHYDLAEGFGLRRNNELLSRNGSTVTNESLALPQAVNGQASLSLRFSLAFGDAHDQLIEVNGQPSAQIVTGEGWSIHDTTLTFSLTGNEANVSVLGRAGNQDKANLAFLGVTYPAAPVVESDQLDFTLPPGGATTLAFSGNTNTSSTLYDLTNRRMYRTGNGAFNLPGSTTSREFVLVNTPLAVVAQAPVALTTNLPGPQADYLILSSRRLAGPELEEMAAYRGSPAGGSYSVHTAYVEDIYDTFGYGLRRHPQAIRNYLHAALRQAPNLNYLFIVGKGREYTDLRTPDALAAAWGTFFVPGFGLPASDNLLTADIGDVRPKLATGRLSAITASEIGIYVRKLREVESQIYEVSQTLDDAAWMKQALFLGGGNSAGERSAIQYNLGTMERILETSRFAGNVTSLFKTSSEPIEEARQDIIFDRINEGVSVLAFYGHSSSQGFDFNIDNPENYHNRNKYPFMLSFGCYSGDAFTESRSISERFIFLPEGGAVTYAASKGLGYISALGSYGRKIFENLAEDHYGEGVGDILRATIEYFAGTSNFTLGILMEQFTLSGDPAFRLHPRPGPDLVIDPASVRFTPEVIPAQDSAYTVDLRIVNLGTLEEGLPDSVLLRVRQELPTGEIRDLGTFTVPVPYYQTEVSLQLPNRGIEAVGNNRLLLTIDVADELVELPASSAESNNDLVIGGRAGVPFTVISNTAKVAYPPRYAVVGPGVELVAGTSDPLAPERKYAIEIARQADFSNPIEVGEIVAPGGVLRYTPSVNWEDSTTYYWRISPDSSYTIGQGYLWSESSFTVSDRQDPAAIGYALQHSGQLSQGDIQNLDVPEKSPVWAFRQNVNYVQINNGIYVNRNMPEFRWNDSRFASPFPWRLNVGMQVLVVDSTNNARWYPSPGDGSYNSVRRSSSPWVFDTRTAEGRQGMIQFLQEYVPDGAYVFVYTAQRGEDINYHTTDWENDSLAVGRTLYGVLEDEGAEQVRLLQSLGSVPYTFIYQKGKGALGEAIGDSQDAVTELRVPIRENWAEGQYTTPAVGPAKSWESMNLAFLADNIEASDSCYLRVAGQLSDGSWDVLIAKALPVREHLRFEEDLRSLDASTYRYLKAQLSIYDKEIRTPVSVRNIYFDFQSTGDAAISPSVAYQVPDTLLQGQVAEMEIGYENLSPVAMDSLLIELTVLDESNRLTRVLRRRPPLAGKGQDTVRFSLPTASITSGLRVQVLLNPENDQPEEVLFNNLLTTDLGIGTDLVAPDLKVYFDGRRISNGELVSSRPEILIQLRDENQFRRLEDSSAYEILLYYPGQMNNGEIIRMSDQRIDYVPAPPNGDNVAEIYFRPELTQDGTYRLRVQAKDRANNKSGRFEYEQEFEVLNEQLITNVLTYPNPFTTQTRFVYTLTGSEPPSTFRIQIMTVSGRVVRDIDLLAYEEIKVGTHQTDFTWDGTDEYGDKLANGVYLYRVITADDSGSPLDSHRDSENEEFRSTHSVTDQFFKNGLGKVVILR